MSGRNPFYLASALFMILGIHLWMNPETIQPNDLLAIFTLYGSLQVYEFALIFIFGRLFRTRRVLSDTLQILFIIGLFLFDALTTHTEFASISPQLGLMVNSFSLVLAFVKLRLILGVLELKLDRLYLSMLGLGLAYLYLFELAIAPYPVRLIFEEHTTWWFAVGFVPGVLAIMLGNWMSVRPEYTAAFEEYHEQESEPYLEFAGFLLFLLTTAHIFMFGFIFGFSYGVGMLAPAMICGIALVGHDRILQRVYTSRECLVGDRDRSNAWVGRNRYEVQMNFVIETVWGKYTPFLFSFSESRSVMPRDSCRQFDLIPWIGGLAVLLASTLSRHAVEVAGVTVSPLRIALVAVAGMFIRTLFRQQRQVHLAYAVFALVLAVGGSSITEIWGMVTHPTLGYAILLTVPAVVLLWAARSLWLVSAYGVALVGILFKTGYVEMFLLAGGLSHVVFYGIGLGSLLIADQRRQTQLQIGSLVLLGLSQFYLLLNFGWSWVILLDFAYVGGLAFFTGTPGYLLALLVPLVYGIPMLLQVILVGIANVLHAFFSSIWSAAGWVMDYLGALLSSLFDGIMSLVRLVLPKTVQQWGGLSILLAFGLLWFGSRLSFRRVRGSADPSPRDEPPNRHHDPE